MVHHYFVSYFFTRGNKGCFSTDFLESTKLIELEEDVKKIREKLNRKYDGEAVILSFKLVKTKKKVPAKMSGYKGRSYFFPVAEVTFFRQKPGLVQGNGIDSRLGGRNKRSET